ncbi:MAG TPA: TIM barrel protein [Sphaerochaeta sp.]|jgi:3-dehydroshikimate dehydratase|nr:TIM barrel protein [Sphaerochaeta sp.]HPZ15725.1 TIM barrel protein [Sphaerochaeta sp.]
MVQSGLVSVTCKTLSIPQLLEAMGDLGLSMVEWSEKWHIEAGAIAQATEAARLSRQHNITVVGYGSYVKLASGCNALPSLRTASALGAPVVRIWGGERPSCELDEEDLASLAQEARAICDEGRKLGLTIALEWHKNSVTDTNESALSFLKRVGRENLRTLWQPTQALDPTERATGLKQVISQLGYLHVYHWDERGRRPLSEGREPWSGYLRSLDPRRVTPALLEFVQHDSMSQLAEDAKTLNGWIAEMNKESMNGKSVQ